MRPLILALLVLFVLSEAFPSNQYQSRYRKSQTQETNIQPFIRFRKSASPNGWIYQPDVMVPYFE